MFFDDDLYDELSEPAAGAGADGAANAAAANGAAAGADEFDPWQDAAARGDDHMPAAAADDDDYN